MFHPQPISRQTSSASSAVATPSDLRSLRGAYVQNVQRLEKSAEEMSASGSDIGDQIRKINALSRQSSLQSSHHGDINGGRQGAMERVSSSMSSRAGVSKRSRVGSNAASRWGGYSPNGYVRSPIGSGSGGWSQASHSRRTSEEQYSQYGRQSQEAWPLPPTSQPSHPAEETATWEEQSRGPSQSSFAQRYDEIAGQIEHSLQHVLPSPQREAAMFISGPHSEAEPIEGTVTPPDRPHSSDTYREAQLAFQDFDGVHFSADTDEFVEFDEYGNEVRRVSARSSTGRLSLEAAALLQTPRARQPSQRIQQLEEGMVYYPAPVPRMLNLPKRLSQQPAANVQSKRRSQMLEQMGMNARDSAPWLSQENVVLGDGQNRISIASETSTRTFNNQRMSANLANLPAHARASMFFEHQPVRHDVELKDGSAVATLDSILEASANAPVSAFTDHPYAGDVRKSVYSVDHKTQKSAGSNTLKSSPKAEKPHKRQSSSISALFKRTASSDDTTAMLKTKGSRSSMITSLADGESPKKLRKSGSRLSLGLELENPTIPDRLSLGAFSEPGLQSGLIASPNNGHADEEHEESDRPVTAMATDRILSDAEQIQADIKEEEAQEDLDDDEGEPMFVKPSTLLAELQVRKAQQKSRGKTAATAFPQGMHSTLLQLDAVEEVEKKKRKKQRIELAWEDPHQRALHPDMDKEDEDVPLGMLFPGKETRKRAGDLDRPIGLLEKRHLEESEPLSNRRNRLRGGSPTRGRAPNLNDNGPILSGGAPNGENEAEFENETLGQRQKRMKAKEEGALKEPEGESSGFAEEILSQFQGLTMNDQTDASKQNFAHKPTPSPALDPNETLGQRRARLQRERDANGQQPNAIAGAPRPPLKTVGSLGSLLSANPAGLRQSSKTYEPSQGTLLHANSTLETNQRTQLQNTNMNASSHYLAKPLVDARPQDQHAPGGLLANEVSKPATGGFAAGTYNNGMGGIQAQPGAATPMLSMNGTNTYFASPTAAPYAGYGYGGMQGYYPQMQQAQMPMPMQMQAPLFAQQSMYPNMYNGFGGAMGMPQMMGNFVGNGYNPGMMGGTYAAYAQSMGANGMQAGMSEEQISQGQRSAIDRWRLGVAHQ